MSIVWSYFA